MQLKHLSLLAAAGLVAAQDNGTSQDLNATLSSQTNLSNLTSFLSLNPALIQQLNSASNLTILAPSDEAFATLMNSSAGEALTSDPGLVSALLQYHILNGTFLSQSITNESTFVPTLLTNESYANVTGGQVVECLLVGNETVFYSGLLQNATVQQADVNFTGGVIHIIDNVLTLPVSVLDTANAANLTSFRGALNNTDSISVANDTPDLTIFAPNNEAFARVFSALQNASTEDIANVLAYHVVNGTVGYSSDLTNGSSLQTANGQNLTVTIDANGTVFVNAAEVVVPNILVANGVVHIIDNVLNPNATEGPQPSATEGVPGFTGATSATDVPFTSGQPAPTTQVNPTSEGAGPAQTEASSSSTGAAMPMKTGAVGAAALFGAAGAVFMGY